VNPSNPTDILTNGDHSVIFWQWSEAGLIPFPPMQDKKTAYVACFFDCFLFFLRSLLLLSLFSAFSLLSSLAHSSGTLTQSAFIPLTSRVITGTSEGKVLLFDYPSNEIHATSQHNNATSSSSPTRIPVKTIKFVVSASLFLFVCADCVKVETVKAQHF
jgi:hypothetical protein